MTIRLVRFSNYFAGPYVKKGNCLFNHLYFQTFERHNLLHIYLCTYLFIYLSIHLYIYLSIYIYIYTYIYFLSIFRHSKGIIFYLFMYLYIYLSIYLYIYLSIYLYMYIYQFSIYFQTFERPPDFGSDAKSFHARTGPTHVFSFYR